jgi:hypothetical protein
MYVSYGGVHMQRLSIWQRSPYVVSRNVAAETKSRSACGIRPECISLLPLFSVSSLW